MPPRRQDPGFQLAGQDLEPRSTGGGSGNPGIGHGLSEQLFSTRAGVLCDRSFGKQDAVLTTQKSKGAVPRRSSMVSYRPNLSRDKHQAFAEEQ